MEEKYLSDEVQNCLGDLFNIIYKKKDKYVDVIIELCAYLFMPSNKYDFVLERYKNVNKELLNRMIVSNFLEITYHRIKNNIPIDSKRLNIFNSLKVAALEENGLVSLVKFDSKSFFIMLNDVLLYLWCTPTLSSYNVVKSMIADGSARILYNIYSLAELEHTLTLDSSFSDKEVVWYTFYEIMINAVEKIIFTRDYFPMPSAGYIQEMINILKEHNGNNLNVSNLHQEIFRNFETSIELSDYNKMLFLEIVIAVLKGKQMVSFPLEIQEKNILANFVSLDKSLESIVGFYDTFNQDLVTILINNWFYFDKEYILQELPEFDEIRKDMQRL